MSQNTKIASLTAIVIFTLVLGAGLSYFVWPKSVLNEFDQKTVSNPKLVEMIAQQQQSLYKKYADLSDKKTLPPKIDEHLKNFFSTIKSISTHTRYGMGSRRNRNAIEIDIEFNDGRSVKNIYTGTSWNGTPYLGPYFLMTVDFDKGLPVSAMTNGIEKKSLPQDLIPQLTSTLQSVIYHEMNKNKPLYSWPKKSPEEIQKSWE